MGRLKNKTAIITGASSGIGRATAELFVDEGAKVALVARRNDILCNIAENVSASAGGAIPLSYDVSLESNWDEILSKTLAAFGSVDILVNNAGIHYRGNGAYLDVFEQEAWDTTFAVNFYSACYGMKRALNYWNDNARTGAIVNVASFASVQPDGNTAYCASKAALVNTSKQQARYWARKRMRINCVSPGIVDTPLNPNMACNSDNYRYQKQQGKNLLANHCEPLQVANAILFLAGDESSYITGVNLPVDGGLLLN